MGRKKAGLVLAGNGAMPKETGCMALGEEQLAALRAAYPEAPDPIRDALACELMVGGGLRVGGVANLTVSTGKGALLTGILRLRAQGNKGGEHGHEIPLVPRAAEALRAQLEQLRRRGQDAPRAPLFPSRKKGGFLQQAQFYRILVAAMERAGIAGREVPGLLGCHALRKTFAIRVHEAAKGIAAEQGGDALDITRAALGHTLVDTTIKYLGLQRATVNAAVLAAAAREPAQLREAA